MGTGLIPNQDIRLDGIGAVVDDDIALSLWINGDFGLGIVGEHEGQQVFLVGGVVEDPHEEPAVTGGIGEAGEIDAAALAGGLGGELDAVPVVGVENRGVVIQGIDVGNTAAEIGDGGIGQQKMVLANSRWVLVSGQTDTAFFVDTEELGELEVTAVLSHGAGFADTDETAPGGDVAVDLSGELAVFPNPGAAGEGCLSAAPDDQHINIRGHAISSNIL